MGKKSEEVNQYWGRVVSSPDIDKTINDLLSGKISVFELSDKNTRTVLIALIKRLRTRR